MRNELDNGANNCKDCQCRDCSNTECPVPCKAFYSCEPPVTRCPVAIIERMRTDTWDKVKDGKQTMNAMSFANDLLKEILGN